MEHKLYLEAVKDEGDADNDEVEISVTVETFIALFLLKFVETPANIQVHIVNSHRKLPKSPLLTIKRNHFNWNILSSDEYKSTAANNCNFPVIITGDDVIVAGLCGVCRNIVKYSNDCYANLLGFKGSCLLAPSEASIWTKFCEVDIVECTKSILLSFENNDRVKESFELPNAFARFESHMSQPIRMHNIYKLARTMANEKQAQQNAEILQSLDQLTLNNDASEKKKNLRSKTKVVKIASNVPITELNLEHKYAEGQQISIADVILFPCFSIMFTQLQSPTISAITSLEQLLPLTFKWMNTVKTENTEKISKCLSFINEPKIQLENAKISYELNHVEKYSLYKSDPKRYKPSNRIFTKQQNIETALDKVQKFGLHITSVAQNESDASTDRFDWTSIPFDALPEGGQLPQNRLQRKKDQLESLAKQIIRIAKSGDRIVDFCSGAGHLGIIIAYKLPQCQIYLLENKEESLMRAKQRVLLLKLTNVRFFQCNLDYFIGDFEIGASLHACGVATDIVLMHCINRKAKFVCCPCCYGGCHQMPHISYPRSKYFRSNDITVQDFMHIAHCADQAHAIQKTSNIEKSLQGQFCMDVVDTDRKLYAEECGYVVTLERLYPEDCTPKNRLLVGII